MEKIRGADMGVSKTSEEIQLAELEAKVKRLKKNLKKKQQTKTTDFLIWEWDPGRNELTRTYQPKEGDVDIGYGPRDSGCSFIPAVKSGLGQLQKLVLVRWGPYVSLRRAVNEPWLWQILCSLERRGLVTRRKTGFYWTKKGTLAKDEFYSEVNDYYGKTSRRKVK
jgi:hypothetical protein